MQDQRFDEPEAMRPNLGTFDRMMGLLKLTIIVSALILIGLLVFFA